MHAYGYVTPIEEKKRSTSSVAWGCPTRPLQRCGANGTGSSSSNGEKLETLPSVGFGELFRFADGLDYILMAIGTAGAIVHGCSLPLFLRFFADLVNSFGANANNVDKMTQEVVKV